MYVPPKTLMIRESMRTILHAIWPSLGHHMTQMILETVTLLQSMAFLRIAEPTQRFARHWALPCSPFLRSSVIALLVP
jgi:hypothetical protein